VSQGSSRPLGVRLDSVPTGTGRPNGPTRRAVPRRGGVRVGPDRPPPASRDRACRTVEEGRLYLTLQGGERTVALRNLIVLRAARRSAHYTCYFYNRVDGSGVRLIAYQYADEASVVDDVPDIRGLLATFAGEEE
jgi:hypothetical protein